MHHTKTKADVGVAKTISDLILKGHTPCLPLSEHQPYDIVAVLGNGKVLKLRVKYATLRKNGTINVRFRTSWADKNGTHVRRYHEKDFDYYALYCPEKDIVPYVRNGTHCPKAIRFEPPKNNQMKMVKWARSYLKI